MCRGFQQDERERLRIKAFYADLLVSVKNHQNKNNLPDFLTLHYLPRINGTLLKFNGYEIRPDSPVFVTLHRVLSQGGDGWGAIYGSRERVVVCEGTKFEIYVGDVKVLRGIFRRDEGGNWKMDCKCVVSGNDVVKGVKGAEVSVAVEGTAGLMTEKVEIEASRRRRRRQSCCELEEIPEEREREVGSDVCCCCECGGEDESCDEDCATEVEMDGVRWAVDVGFWVVCLGVGYLVSRASSRRLRRTYQKKKEA